MNGWTPERLPITFAPAVGEALDSWLEAYAWRLNTTSRHLLDHLGLPKSTPTQMLLRPTAAEQQTLCAATGLDSGSLQPMLLDRLDGIAVTINPRTRRVEHPPAWRRQRGSRFCPECLAESGGRWQVSWRLSWTAVCLDHHRILADFCPACIRRPYPHRFGHRTDLTGPGHCLLPNQQSGGGTHKPSCAHPLADTMTPTLPRGGHIATASQWLHTLIATASRTDPAATPTRQILDDLFLLCGRTLIALHTSLGAAPEAVTAVLAEAGSTLPPPFAPLGQTHAHTVAVASTLAIIAHQEHSCHSQAVLEWICLNDNSTIAKSPHLLLNPYRQCGPELLGRVRSTFSPRLRRDTKLRHQTRTGTTELAGSTTFHPRASALPAALWPDWAMRLLPHSRGDTNRVTAIQAALAVLALLPGSRLSQPKAITLLGGYAYRSMVRSILTTLDSTEAEPIIALLGHLAHKLDTDPAPIDYQRRRAIFTEQKTTVAHRRYARLAAAYGWSANTRGGQPHPLQLRLINRHLLAMLTGAPPRTTPRDSADAFNPLTMMLPAAAWVMLHDEASRLLRHHDITEPVTWTPPLTADTPVSPGIEPAAIDAQLIAEALQQFATHTRPLARLTEATGLPPAHLRLYAQASQLVIPDQVWAMLTNTSPRDTTASTALVSLYQQRTPLHTLASQTLATTTSVRRTLTRQGIGLPRSRPPQKDITAQWFQDNYLHTSKTTRQAAKEAGCSVTTLRRYAAMHHIPFGASALQANPFVTWKHPPPAQVIAAAAIHGGLAHLRRLVTAAAYRTQRQGAAAQGITERQLSRTKKTIEKAAGITIFKPTSGYLLPTPEGESFLHHAAKALRHLDRYGTLPSTSDTRLR